jgi:hypothetical protein
LRWEVGQTDAEAGEAFEAPDRAGQVIREGGAAGLGDDGGEEEGIFVGCVGIAFQANRGVHEADV